MIIDIVVLIILLYAAWKGYSKGLIVALFSLIAFVVGLAAALKLSAVVANWLGTHVNIAQQWMPILSFSIVFIAVIYIVRIGAKLIEKTIKLALLGWVNKIGGIVFYAIIYLMIFSIFLFYTKQLNIITQSTINESKLYDYIIPFGEKAMNAIGNFIPIFKNLFTQLENFFGNIKTK